MEQNNKLKIISEDKKEFILGEELKFCDVIKNLMEFQGVNDDYIESEQSSEIIQIFTSILKYYNEKTETWMFSETIPNIKLPEDIMKLINPINNALYCLAISYKLLCLSDRWKCNLVKYISIITISDILNKDIDNITNEDIKQIFELEN